MYIKYIKLIIDSGNIDQRTEIVCIIWIMDKNRMVPS